MTRHLPIALLSLLGAACLTEAPTSPTSTSSVPVDLNDGWPIATPESVGLDPAALGELVDELRAWPDFWQLRSLLIAREGHLVSETYLRSLADIDRLHPIWSCTKQVLGILTGVALNEGVLESVDERALAGLPYMSAHPGLADSVRVEDLLTMRSGLHFDEADDAAAILRRSSGPALPYILSRPRRSSPGDAFQYSSGDSHLLLEGIRARLDEPFSQWAEREFFRPLGIESYEWATYDGVPFGGWGLMLRPRDLLRVAQLVLDRGNVGARTLVSESWIEEMLTPRVSDAGGELADFGYQWWIRRRGEGFYMAGSGGQFAVVFPRLQLVVSGTSEPDTDGALELSAETFLGIADRVANAVTR